MAGTAEWYNGSWLDAPTDTVKYDPHEAHLERIKARFAKDVSEKYRKGQREHGGNLWEKPGMLDYALEEVLDLAVYLYTLKEQEESRS